MALENVRKAELLKKELDDLRPLDGEQEARIMQKFRLDWNYHSNHLEGNSLTFGETKALILHGITAQGKPLKDHFEITGHDEAIKWIDDVLKDKRPLTENFIRELHTLLLKEPHEKSAITSDGSATKRIISVGKYKTHPNHVKTQTGEIFYFATPEETPAKMHDLLNWYREQKETKNSNPILLAAEFHYKFIRIHPFDDGNGRTARILMNFILMQFGFPPVIIKTEDKENYFIALQQADAGILEPFIEYIAKNLANSLEIMIKGAKGESVEEDNDIDKEIFLLEQKLNSISKKANTLKSRSSILKIFNDFIIPFVNPLISISEKFSKFYSESGFLLWVDNSTSKRISPVKLIQSAFTRIQLPNEAEINALMLEYFFSDFKQIGMGEFNYSTKIRFDFNKTFYTITSENLKYFITKSYDEGISNDEIKTIIDKEMKHHTKYIQRQIEQHGKK
jgi:Fic family protein